MKKTIKVIFGLIGTLVLLLVLALALHPLWVGPALKTSVAKFAPKFTGTPVTLGTCEINLYKGLIWLGDFELANPEMCEGKTAVSFGTFRVEADVASALTDVIVVKEITLTDVYASVEQATPEKTNLEIIADHAATATKSDGAAEKPAEKREESVAKTESAQEQEPAQEGGKKVIIEKLTIGNLTVSYLGMKIPVPGTIVLTDIGKDTQGVSWQGAWEEIARQLQKKFTSVGDGVLSLGNQGLDVGTAGVTNALEAVKAMDVDGAKAILKDTGKDLKALGKDFGKDFGKDLEKDFKNLLK